jgi:plastocyanin
MKRWLRALLPPAIVALGLPAALLVAPAVAVAGDPCYHDFVLPARTLEATTEIKVMPCAFGPSVAQVPVGATVTFVNGPDFTHLVTGANQEWGSRDVELAPGATVSYSFPSAGVYPYACALHRGMSGTIIVGDAPLTAAAVPPVDGAGSNDSSVAAAQPGAGLQPFIGGVAAGAIAASILATIVVTGRRRSATAASAGPTTDAAR